MKIKELRAQTGMSQSQFAARFRIPLRTLQHWEQGRQEPAEYVVAMIEQLIKVESAPVPVCKFTYDFDAAIQFKRELEKEIPGIYEKLSVVEVDKFIDFVHNRTLAEALGKGK